MSTGDGTLTTLLTRLPYRLTISSRHRARWLAKARSLCLRPLQPRDRLIFLFQLELSLFALIRLVHLFLAYIDRRVVSLPHARHFLVQFPILLYQSLQLKALLLLHIRLDLLLLRPVRRVSVRVHTSIHHRTHLLRRPGEHVLRHTAGHLVLADD